ncbi:MAG: hypothetical protein IGR76_18300 [Synechococcales cyanobacterium T60_A2020_003]|nr:hypothetical protein [Synechococcales cyanobacterium T60_A2020_003]
MLYNLSNGSSGLPSYISYRRDIAAKSGYEPVRIRNDPRVSESSLFAIAHLCRVTEPSL